MTSGTVQYELWARRGTFGWCVGTKQIANDSSLFFWHIGRERTKGHFKELHPLGTIFRDYWLYTLHFWHSWKVQFDTSNLLEMLIIVFCA